ncbi:LysR substrate-binding domain-containing protein [Asaia sp. As-1742]|uniref:LysR substrate-binding domain-containing protein n=1 Tax=Asaia sp. As-1742 TaxID=2608325 RepID=UPI001421225D|nr:LysR substrate-binding domain-containing protein [Asaia sp. As-1742]NIE79013.1 LysR family transcriptional regulator [Asaia sp. As-1742]
MAASGVSKDSLESFIAIAQAGSFARAASLRGVTGSALSHAMTQLERKLAVRLFHRTTRQVRLTGAGEMLLAEIAPQFARIDATLAALDAFRASPSGRLRITTLRDAANLLLAPRLAGFMAQYPAIELDIVVDDRVVDIVSEGFDAGIRYGGTVPEGMIATRLTGDLNWVVVGAPAYLDAMGRPQQPEDLMQHRCIRIRTGTGRLYPWELGEGSRQCVLDVPGQVILGDSELSLACATAGGGLFYCLEKRAQPAFDNGQLELVLPEWASLGEGFHAYYPSRRHVPAALKAFTAFFRIPSA